MKADRLEAAFTANSASKSSISAGAASDRLLTINDIAAWLGVSKAWVYDHITRKQPRLPHVRFGEITRFRREDIERFIAEHGGGNASRSPYGGTIDPEGR